MFSTYAKYAEGEQEAILLSAHGPEYLEFSSVFLQTNSNGKNCFPPSCIVCHPPTESHYGDYSSLQ